MGQIGRIFFSTSLAWAVVWPAVAADEITLETTVVSGNQELPRVLYVLPWRSAEGAPIPARERAAADRTGPGPVRPVELRRHLKLLAGPGSNEANETNHPASQEK